MVHIEKTGSVARDEHEKREETSPNKRRKDMRGNRVADSKRRCTERKGKEGEDKQVK